MAEMRAEMQRRQDMRQTWSEISTATNNMFPEAYREIRNQRSSIDNAWDDTIYSNAQIITYLKSFLEEVKAIAVEEIAKDPKEQLEANGRTKWKNKILGEGDNGSLGDLKSKINQCIAGLEDPPPALLRQIRSNVTIAAPLA